MSETSATRQLELDDIESVMTTESGRRSIHRLLVEAGLYQTSYLPEHPNATQHTLFKEGKRNGGLFLLSEISNFPGSYVLMMKEAQDD